MPYAVIEKVSILYSVAAQAARAPARLPDHRSESWSWNVWCSRVTPRSLDLLKLNLLLSIYVWLVLKATTTNNPQGPTMIPVLYLYS